MPIYTDICTYRHKRRISNRGIVTIASILPVQVEFRELLPQCDAVGPTQYVMVTTNAYYLWFLLALGFLAQRRNGIMNHSVD